MDWLFEARRDIERPSPRISIPGVASIVYWVNKILVTHLLTEPRPY